MRQTVMDNKTRLARGFTIPDYSGYCITNIAGAVKSLFGIAQAGDPLSRRLTGKFLPKKVVLFIVDGFGYEHWQYYSKQFKLYPSFNEKGMVIPLTSVFPSTTPAALTSIITGVTPAEHGLFENVFYWDKPDQLINPLMFSGAYTGEKDALLKDGFDPEQLYSFTPLPETLSSHGITCYDFVDKEHAGTAYASATSCGANVVGYSRLNDLFGRLLIFFERAKDPSFFSVYWPDIDSAVHRSGPYSKIHAREVERFDRLFKNLFLNRLDKSKAKDTLIIITSDHGSIRTNPKDTIYLSNYPEITCSLAKSGSGKTMLPWGNFRDLFLQIKEPEMDNVMGFLKDLLKNKALVLRSEEAVKEGLFGACSLPKRFMSRIGNVIVVPDKEHIVWYRHDGADNNVKQGDHGGLTKEEMLVPFAVAELSILL